MQGTEKPDGVRGGAEYRQGGGGEQTNRKRAEEFREEVSYLRIHDVIYAPEKNPGNRGGGGPSSERQKVDVRVQRTEMIERIIGGHHSSSACL